MSVTERRASIFSLIVREYVETAAPVGSKMLREKYHVPVSPATIRNEMQALELDGLLRQPHTSAGRVPSDRGYRFFVESLMVPGNLSDDEQATIRHQFYQTPPELDEWVELAAVLLARSLGLMAIVAPPRAHELQVRHLELIGLNELLALLVVVLREARVLKQLVPLESSLSQDDLSVMAHRLNEQVSGKSAMELRLAPDPEHATQAHVMQTLRRLLAEESIRDTEPQIEGFSAVLSQPEFQEDHERALRIVSLIDQHAGDRVVPFGALEGDGVSVVIGEENHAEELRECSVVLAPYGFSAGMSGYVGVLGPTRMHYAEGVAAVRYFSGLLQEMIERFYG